MKFSIRSRNRAGSQVARRSVSRLVFAGPSSSNRFHAAKASKGACPPPINVSSLPLDVMLCRMKHEPLPNGSLVTDDQFAAAVAAAPYLHAKLSAAVFKGEIEVGGAGGLMGDPANLTREELVVFLPMLSKYMGLSPEVEGSLESPQ
jgi:hypothetical protein